MPHARITKHGLFQFVMALTAGEVSVALEELGTAFVSLALCCHKKPAHWLGIVCAAHVGMACTRLGKKYAETAWCTNKYQLAAYVSCCGRLVSVCDSISSNC